MATRKCLPTRYVIIVFEKGEVLMCGVVIPIRSAEQVG